MKNKTRYIKIALMVLCAAFTMSVGASALAQDKNQPKVSADEQKAAKKVQDAKDIATKMQAADEFVKKFPKSSLRQQIAELIAREIDGVKDAAQKVSFSEQFFSIFTEANETDAVIPSLVDAYLQTKKHDEAFQVAGNFLSRHPEDIFLLTLMVIEGTNLARTGNAKFAGQSAEYANKAIELIEAEKKPANYDEAKWTGYKTNNLPALYQSAGVLAMMSGKTADAKSRLEKAVSLNSSDPFNYFLLGSMIEDEYRKTAQLYNVSPVGKERDALLGKANSQLDQVIDYYARALAAADGKPDYQQFAAQLRSDLESYYKFRNKNSLDGLQQLIDKYKPLKP
jgi:hypothetical protein